MHSFEFKVNMIGIGRTGIECANYVMGRNDCINDVITLASDEDSVYSHASERYNSFYTCKMKLFEYEADDSLTVVVVDAKDRYECSLAGNVAETMAMMEKPCVCIAVMPIKVGEIYYNATRNLDQIDTGMCAVIKLENNLYKDAGEAVFRIIYSINECLGDYALRPLDYKKMCKELTGRFLYTAGYMDDITSSKAVMCVVEALENYAPFKRCDMVRIFAETGDNVTDSIFNILKNNFSSLNDVADIEVYACASEDYSALEGVVSLLARM